MPVRDAEPYLDDALRSVAEQTHEEPEGIGVDDGSRDGSAGHRARVGVARPALQAALAASCTSARKRRLRRYERWLNSLTTVEAARRDLFVECPIGHPTLLARADAVAYRAVDGPEDYDLVLRLWAARRRFWERRRDRARMARPSGAPRPDGRALFAREQRRRELDDFVAVA